MSVRLLVSLEANRESRARARSSSVRRRRSSARGTVAPTHKRTLTTKPSAPRSKRRSRG